MTRLLDVIAAHLLEGSLVPILGPGLHRAAPFPAGADALAGWLAARSGAPGGAPGGLWSAAARVEAAGGRRGLDRALREAFSARAEAEPLQLLLAGLPSLPLVISTWYDTGPLELLREAALAGGRSVAVAAGGPCRDGGEAPDAAWLSGEGLAGPGQAATLLYQPIGVAVPQASLAVTEADFGAWLGGWDGAPVPEPVRRRCEGSGFLLAGCRFGALPERLVTRALVGGAPGPHFAVLPGPATAQERHFLAAEGITALDLPQERFTGELSRRLAGAGRPGEGGRGWPGAPASAATA